MRAAFARDESARQRVALYSERRRRESTLRSDGTTSASNMAFLPFDDGDSKPRASSFGYE